MKILQIVVEPDNFSKDVAKKLDINTKTLNSLQLLISKLEEDLSFFKTKA